MNKSESTKLLPCHQLKDDSSRQRRFVYVLPELAVDSHQHFGSIPHLLEEISRYCEVIVLVEKWDGVARLSGVKMDYVGSSIRVVRLFRTVAALVKWRFTGVRIYFVRISRITALLTGLLCRMTGSTLNYWHCDAITYRWWPSPGAFKDWRLSELQARLTFFLCNRLVTGTASMAKHYVNEMGIPRQKIVVVPNDVDLRRFTSRGATRQHTPRSVKISTSRNLAVIAHRFSPKRRLPWYLSGTLDALSELQDWSLLMIGDGPDRKTLEAQVAARGMSARVTFIGTVAHRDMPNYLKQADIFLGPSYVEGFPRIVIEAMAAALPLVVTDAGGTRDLLPPELDEWVVRRDDAVSFGTKFRDLACLSEDTREKIGQRLRDHVQIYDTRVVATRYVEILFDDPAVGARPPAAAEI